MTHTMNMNKEALDVITKKLIKAKADIKNSNHDRLNLGDSDIEVSDDCVSAWADSLKIPMPSDWHFSTVKELPEEFLEEVFGDLTTQEEMNVIKTKEEYKTLFELYSGVFDDMYYAAAEETAYYDSEYQDQEEFYDSMRGSI